MLKFISYSLLIVSIFLGKTTIAASATNTVGDSSRILTPASFRNAVRLSRGYLRIVPKCNRQKTRTSDIHAAYKPARPCKVLAHRGSPAIAPENTLVSFDMAIKSGADYCEFDVYASADGALVVMHDQQVDRTTNGHGDITKLTLDEIKRLDAGSWKDRRYAGEQIPTLDETLAKFKNSGCKAVIEIKMPGISKKVVDAVRCAGMLDQTVVLSFDENAIKEVRALEPRLECGLNCCMPKEVMKKTLAQQADWISSKADKSNTRFVSLERSPLSAGLLAELQKRNVFLWVWMINDPKMVESLLGYGVVTSISTDHPEIMCKRLDKMP